MNFKYPYEDFGGSGPLLHFAHANGYPPRAYRRLLSGLSSHYHVFAMHMRPLWDKSDPEKFSDWRLLAQDLEEFLIAHSPLQWIGMGHSMGANATLRLAVNRPDRFSALLLIDPVIFPPYLSYVWTVVYRLGLAYRLHPLIRSALKRRKRFSNQEEMFNNYRSKPVFNRISDEDLANYVEALACFDSNGAITLCYPPEWEARIYASAIRADLEIWRKLVRLKPPTLVIRGGLTDTFLPATAAMFTKRNPEIKILTFPDCTHLLPLEKPQEIQQSIQVFLDAHLPAC